MDGRTARKLLAVAGTLVSAIVASDGMATAQIPTTLPTTTIEVVTTTTTTASTTTTTTTLSPGGLSISVPAAVELSPGTPVNARAVTAQLGPVTVTDARVGLVAGWTVSVSGSDFIAGAGTPAETIGRGNVAYWSGPATATSGAGTFLPGQLTQLDAMPLSGPRTAFSALASVGGTSATWVPGLVVSLPLTSVTGQYHGTITHSVA